jgi:hypothetical protein
VSDAGRKLSAVGSVPASGRPAAAAPAAERARRERALLAILGVLLAVALVGLALSLGRNARQGRELAALAAELDTTRAVLGAYEARFADVRDAVARLHALVEGVPAAPAPTDPEPAPEAPAP